METEAENNGSSQQPDLDKVLEKINEIAKKSADGDYIYRGEPECYEKVSSSLYREFPDLDRLNANVARTQKAILEEAKSYIGQTDDIDETDDIGLLTEIQHFGGKTNLIDFTEDSLIALFFACDGSHEKDGRVILLKRESQVYEVRKPRRAINRVESQKSVFVESFEGFVVPNIEVTVPVHLKFPILDYLKQHHRISIETIYNDLHGFIRRSAHTEFLKGLTCQRKAREAKTNGKKHEFLENAIRHYTEALKLKFDYDTVYNNRGLAYTEADDFDAAIQDFNKAINLNPEDAGAYNGRGVAYSNKSNFDAAIADYNTAIDLNPEDARVYSNRGVAYGNIGDFGAAIADFNKVMDLAPEDAGAYNGRGVAYSKIGDFGAAIEDFSKAIALNPENANGYSNRGLAYARNRDFHAAIEDFNTAIALNPENANVYNNRGVAYNDIGDFGAAIEDFNTAIALNPENALFYGGRGVAYGNIGDFGAAIEDFNKTIALNPEDANSYSNRGVTWLHLKEWQKAKADLTTAKDMGVDIVAFFQNDYESVEPFEAKNGVTLPKDIAALLSGNKVNDTRQKRSEQYWAAFFKALPSDQLGLKIPSIYDSHYRDFHMGITGCYIRVSQRVRPAGIAAAFVMIGSAQAFFHLLIEQQTAIENELGEKFYCSESVQGEKQLYVALKYCDVTDKTDWSAQHQWLAMKLEKLVEVFRPRIEKLI